MKRFEVRLTELDPTRGAEMQKTRPCIIISQSTLNRMLMTVFVVPLTAARHSYPSRVPCMFAGRQGEVALDQMRCVDKGRLVRRVGALQTNEAEAVLSALQEMFSP